VRECWAVLPGYQYHHPPPFTYQLPCLWPHQPAAGAGMDREQNQLQAAPQLCRNSCGFYGSPNFDGLCSKCHKDKAKTQAGKAAQDGATSSGSSSSDLSQRLLASPSAQPNPAQPGPSQPSGSAQPAEPGHERLSAAASAAPGPMSTSPASPIAQDDFDGTEDRGASTSDDAAAASPADPSGKKPKSRCEVCRKKVGLTGFTCRCDGLFCAVHRYSDKHDCSFDYRCHGQQEIRKNNPVIIGEKVNKI